MAYLRSKSKKKLTLIVDPDSPIKTKDYKLILNNFQSLQSLCLELDPWVSDLVTNEDIIFIQDIRKIQNVVIRGSSNVKNADQYTENQRNNLNNPGMGRGQRVRMRNDEDSTYKDLTNRQFKVIALIDSNNTHNGYLKYLRLHECHVLPSNYKKDNFFARYLTNGRENEDRISDKMRSLEHLDLEIQATLDKQILHTLLDSFDSLKILNLHVSMSENREAWDDNLPYERLKYLHELRIDVTEIRYKDGSDSPYNIAKFGVCLGKSLSQLKDLRVFELHDRVSGKMGLNVFFGLLKPCSQLTQLERLIICADIESGGEDTYDEYDIMPEIWNDMIRQRRKVIEDLLGRGVENIKATNSNLSLEGFHLYGKDHIWYDKNGRTKIDYEKERNSLYDDVRLSLLQSGKLF